MKSVLIVFLLAASLVSFSSVQAQSPSDRSVASPQTDVTVSPAIFEVAGPLGETVEK